MKLCKVLTHEVKLPALCEILLASLLGILSSILYDWKLAAKNSPSLHVEHRDMVLLLSLESVASVYISQLVIY